MLFDPEALRRVIDFLNEHHLPYMLIGGLAISIRVKLARPATLILRSV